MDLFSYRLDAVSLEILTYALIESVTDSACVLFMFTIVLNFDRIINFALCLCSAHAYSAHWSKVHSFSAIFRNFICMLNRSFKIELFLFLLFGCLITIGRDFVAILRAFFFCWFLLLNTFSRPFILLTQRNIIVYFRNRRTTEG